MKLFWYEVRKALSSAAVWIFVAICLAINILTVISESKYVYADFVGGVSKETGVILGDEFSSELESLTVGEAYKQYKDVLQAQTSDPVDVFADYRTDYIAESYISARGLTGKFADAMRAKYAAMQGVIDEKVKIGEGMTLYFAGITHDRHEALFSTVCGRLTMGGMLLAALLTLLLIGYERMNRTEQIVYSTNIGRLILRRKLLAAMTAGIALYALMTAITLAVWFSANEYGSTWGSGVSGGFNYIADLIAGNRPFATWFSFSVLEYLFATAGLSAAVIACFVLMGFIVGIWTRNSYIGFIVLVILTALLVWLPSWLPVNSYSYFTAMLSPIWLWLKRFVWFTDGDMDIIWRNFELLGTAGSLLILSALCVLTAKMFRKRNIA
jgi:hypothetical protein